MRKLSDKESRELRLHEFGFVFQSFNLLEDDTVLNNIRMNLDSLCSLDDEYKNKRIEEIINLLDLKEIKNRQAMGRSTVDYAPLLVYKQNYFMFSFYNS